MTISGLIVSTSTGNDRKKPKYWCFHDKSGDLAIPLFFWYVENLIDMAEPDGGPSR